MFSLAELSYLKGILNTYSFEGLDLLDDQGLSLFNQAYDPAFSKRATGEGYYPIHLNDSLSVYLKILDDNEDLVNQCVQLMKVVLNQVMQQRRQGNISLLDDFILDLLSQRSNNLETDFVNRAQLLAFDFSKERIPVLVDIKSFRELSQSQETHQQIEVKTKLNQVKHLLLESLQSQAEYVVYLYDDKFVLLKEVGARLEAEFEAVNQTLKEVLNLSARFIIGRPCATLDAYYRDFQKLLELHQQWVKRLVPFDYFYLDDYLLELTLRKLAAEDRAFYLADYGDSLEQLRLKDTDFVQTFKTFVKHSFDTQRTAQALHVHKNTVYYRINQLSEQVERPLCEAYEAFKFYLALLLDEVEE